MAAFHGRYLVQVGALTMLMAAAVMAGSSSGAAKEAVQNLLAGRFRWRASQPLVAPVERPEAPYVSMKDPSVAFADGRWHLFCTIRTADLGAEIEYLSFTDWRRANAAPRTVLRFAVGRGAAPQVFYFAPHRKWYLICQASDESWDPKSAAAFATSENIADPRSWSRLTPLGAKYVDGKRGLDFWVICDDAKAYLFFTSLDGRMWREETRLEDFPHGWSEGALAIRGDIFEASHTYALKGLGKYLTLVEAQGGHGWRYYKAYLADRLDGEWTPLAATREKCFASMANVEHVGQRWTDCISHGELIRAGVDQKLEVDPANLRFVFQGVLDRDRAGKAYGQIPWRLGILAPAAPDR